MNEFYIEKSSGLLYKLVNINCLPYYDTTYNLRYISDDNSVALETEVNIEDLYKRFEKIKIDLVIKEN